MNGRTEKKLELMREGGAILARVRDGVVESIKPGVTFEELEALAQKLIKDEGALPSFPTVEGYHWATCITKNEGCCHGIPKGHTVEDKDLITVDVGVLYKGFHTDTSITVPVGKVSNDILHFLETGKKALENAIDKARVGNTVYDISKAIQDTVEAEGYSSVFQLTGHGISKNLHEEPNIPCFADEDSKKEKLYEGQTIAIEPMYAMGNPRLRLAKDGWTYETVDKSLTGMFEHTIFITGGKPEILTKSLS